MRHLIVFTPRLESIAACDHLDYTNENWDALGETGWACEMECPACETLRVTALANGLYRHGLERAHTMFVIWNARLILDAPPVTIEEAKWRAWKLTQGSDAHGSKAKAEDADQTRA